MKRFQIISLFLMLAQAASFSQDYATATQVVTLEVRSVTSLAVSGNPGPLTIQDAAVGTELLSVSDNSTRYSVTSNRDNVRLTLSIDKPMPPGSRLLASLESGPGQGYGVVDLSSATSPIVAVSGIPSGRDRDRRIVYTLEADASVGTIAATTRTITLTLTD